MQAILEMLVADPGALLRRLAVVEVDHFVETEERRDVLALHVRNEPILSVVHLLGRERQAGGDIRPVFGFRTLHQSHETHALGLREHGREPAGSEVADAEERGDELEAPEHVRADTAHGLVVAAHDAADLVVDRVDAVAVLAHEVEFPGVGARGELRHQPLGGFIVAACAEVHEVRDLSVLEQEREVDEVVEFA